MKPTSLLPFLFALPLVHAQQDDARLVRRSAPRADARLGEDFPAAVLFDVPELGGPLWALGRTWKASFDATGATFVPFFGSQAPRNFPVRLELVGASAGGEALGFHAGAPARSGDRVCVDRGALVEQYDLSLFAVEQSFVFPALPNRGDVVVDVRLDSELGVTVTEDGLRLANGHGVVDYSKAVAVDAAGRRAPLSIGWNGSIARVVIPADFVEAATLPLVLDPLLFANGSLASGQTQLQTRADVAVLANPEEACVVWRRQWSVTDQDCFAQRVNATLTPVGGAVAVDFTSEDWLHPAIASNAAFGKYLVVSQVDVGTASWIAGRIVDRTSGIDPKIDIERAGVVGVAGKKFRPDVGGDPFSGAGSPGVFTVVWEQETGPASSEIRFKQVTGLGALVTTYSTVFDGSPGLKRNVSISKSNDASRWLVAYHSFAGLNANVRCGQIRFNGQITVPPVDTTTTGAFEGNVSASSPIDQGNNTYWMVVYEAAWATEADIFCQVFDAAGTLYTTWNLSAAESSVSVGYDQRRPSVDSDGSRFVVAYSEPYLGQFDRETKLSTVAWIASTGQMRLEETRVSLGASVDDEDYPQVASAFTGGFAPNAHYFVVDEVDGANDIQGWVHGGYTPGTLFSWFPSQCGTLSITPSGSPVVGGYVMAQVGNGPASGTVLGFPGYTPLAPLGCSCVLGVSQPIFTGNPMIWNVPNDPIHVGTTLSVQGWTVLGSNCLGTFDLSDTVDFTIR